MSKPTDGRLTSLATFTGTLSASDLMEVVVPADPTYAVNYKLPIGDLASVIGATVLNVVTYGADPTGVADSTAAFNAAIEAAQASHGLRQGQGPEIWAVGEFLLGSLTMPDPDVPVVIKIYGTLTLTETFIHHSKMTIIGLGGPYQSTSQFQNDPSFLVDGTNLGSDTAWNIHGYATLENVHIRSDSGTALLFEDLPGNAVVRCINVSAQTTNGATTAPAAKINSMFWIWCNSCRFSGSGNNAALHITNDASNVIQSGLLYFDDLILNRGGIIIDAGGVTGPLGVMQGMFFRNLAQENLSASITTGGVLLDGSLGETISNIVFDGYESADAIGDGTLHIKGSVTNLQLLGKNDLKNAITIETGGSLTGLFVDSTPAWGTVAQDGWFAPRNTAGFAGDFILGALHQLGDPQSPAVCPIAPATLSSGQDASGWAAEADAQADDISVVYGVAAPDGTPTAATVTSTSSGTHRFTYDEQTYTPAVGDIVIVGAWLKNTMLPSRLPNDSLTISWANSNVHFDFEESNVATIAAGNTFGSWNNNLFIPSWQVDSWIPVVAKFRVTATPGGVQTLRLRTSLTSTSQAVTIWHPFYYYIPNGTMTADEATRFYQSLRRGPVGSQPGDIALLNHQKLKLGGGVRVYSSAAQPTKYTWAVGDRIYDSSGAAGGWRCTAAGGAFSATRANTTTYTTGVWAAWSSGTTVVECTTAGITAGSAPTAPTTVGQTVTDGSVVWTCRSLTNVTFAAGI